MEAPTVLRPLTINPIIPPLLTALRQIFFKLQFVLENLHLQECSRCRLTLKNSV